MEDKKLIKYGEDDFTCSINKNERKTEDWHSDFNGKIVINGETFYLNLYQKKDTWFAGKVVKAKKEVTPQRDQTIVTQTVDDDEIPF